VHDGLGQTITYNKHQIYEIIADYNWMLKFIREAGEQEVEFKGTAQYGVEASLPRGQGLVSQALENEVMRRNDRLRRLFDYLKKVNFIKDNRKKLTDIRETEILDYLLDGKSVSAISRIIGMSRQQIDKIRSDIVDKLCN
jgi:DNA-binding NarL/FixJ family response regulator